MVQTRLAVRAAVALAGFSVVLAGCAKTEEKATTTPGADAGQKVQSASGDLCTMEKYAGKGVKKIDLKTAKIGFAQSEKEANPFRTAETQSIKDEAAKRGIKNLVVTNAGGDLNKEISDIQSMLSQGVEALIVSPLKSEGLDPALDAAKAKGVPVFTIDRLLSSKKACEDYLGWVGSDFVKQGEQAAKAMIKATGGKGKGVTLLGLAGVNVTDDRNKGYKDYMTANGKDFQIIAEQAGDFDRQKGQTVTEQLLQSNPDLTAIYAHNDEMALGAVTALQAKGKKPGDVKIITIDGTRGAVQGIIDGWISGVIESNPRFGPISFQSLEDFYGGKGVPALQIISDKEYTPENAKAEVANAY
jgi:ABC-type sugar transport system substrate-binding protein